MESRGCVPGLKEGDSTLLAHSLVLFGGGMRDGNATAGWHADSDRVQSLLVFAHRRSKGGRTGSDGPDGGRGGFL